MAAEVAGRENAIGVISDDTDLVIYEDVRIIMSLHSCHFIPRHRSGEKGGQCVTLHMFAARLRPDRSDLFAESGLVRGRLPEDLELDYLKKRPSDRDRRF